MNQKNQEAKNRNLEAHYYLGNNKISGYVVNFNLFWKNSVSDSSSED